MTLGLVHFNHTTQGGLTGWPDPRTAKWMPNYGDMLVCDAVMRQLRGMEGERGSISAAPRAGR
jgi:hypothetical protein